VGLDATRVEDRAEIIALLSDLPGGEMWLPTIHYRSAPRICHERFVMLTEDRGDVRGHDERQYQRCPRGRC
jgi:hypothetical protein